MSFANKSPLAVVFGCAGLSLTDEERALFQDADPVGLILFGRNIDHPEQVRALINDFRQTVGRADAPVLIDQEGGRVARLKPPHWRKVPPMGIIGTLAEQDREAALEAAWLNARLMAADLIGLGITVDCAPVLDIPAPDSHDIIGDRALGRTPEQVIALADATCRGFLAGGVLPVIKHQPGHGRALEDSHETLPTVTAERGELEALDFVPFKALSHMPWGMTAHVVYRALDPLAPATTSPTVISQVIRGEIGFDGVLASDDITMKALSGHAGERAEAALNAGCDVVLHCNGDLAEMKLVAERARPLTREADRRLDNAEALRRADLHPLPDDARQRLDALLAPITTG